MDYIEVTVTCAEEQREILTAELAEAGFESFLESEEGLQAYIPMLNFEASSLHELTEAYPDWNLQCVVKIIAQQNWNEEWEKNYEPIRVEDTVLVRATFHEPDAEVPYQIEINPKMSFGTGHHATTYLMLKHMLSIPVAGKRVYDVGTGTGILAIMAAKLGASHIEANDVEQWTVENSRENCEINGFNWIQVFYGNLSMLSPKGDYDLMLANINRNILLDELPQYAKLMKSGGHLLLSGFYEEDISDLIQAAQKEGLTCDSQDVRDRWACLRLVK